MVKLDLIRWLISGLLAGLYIWMVAVQALWVWKAVIKKEKVGHILEALFLGIPSGVFSSLVLPFPSLRHFWWITLLFNFAGIVYLVFIGRLILRRVFRSK